MTLLKTRDAATPPHRMISRGLRALGLNSTAKEAELMPTGNTFGRSTRFARREYPTPPPHPSRSGECPAVSDADPARYRVVGSIYGSGSYDKAGSIVT